MRSFGLKVVARGLAWLAEKAAMNPRIAGSFVAVLPIGGLGAWLTSWGLTYDRVADVCNLALRVMQ